MTDDYEVTYNLKLFIKFLKKEHSLEKYLFNLNLKKSNSESEVFILYQLTEYPPCMIFNAFTWKETKEGFDYWQNLHYKWRDYYCKLRK